MSYQFDTFQTIPHAPRYEMNRQGDIRNKKTGQIRRWQQRSNNSKVMTLRLGGGRTICVSLSSLLWLLFGKVAGSSSKMAVPVTISKGNRTFKFDSLKACAKFLAREERQTIGTGANLLSKRCPVIFGWAVKYLRN